MATKTLGTNGTTSLVAVQYSRVSGVLSDADFASIAQAILSDQNVTHPMAQLIGVGGLTRDGLLYLPDNRGVVHVRPGDWIGIDTSSGVGWPVLVSANAIANGLWTHS